MSPPSVEEENVLLSIIIFSPLHVNWIKERSPIINPLGTMVATLQLQNCVETRKSVNFTENTKLRGSFVDKVLCQVLADSNSKEEYFPSMTMMFSRPVRASLFIPPWSLELFLPPLRGGNRAMIDYQISLFIDFYNSTFFRLFIS